MYRPPQCTEREPDGSYEDCTWASGVMLQNAAHGDAVVPSTRKEYEALRVAGGDGPAENPGDGSNLGDLQAGFQNRYSWKPAYFLPSSTSDLWVRLPAGSGAVVQGSMGALDPYWRRWDEQFRGAHAVYVQREDGQDRVWWMNPLAPADYAGEWMPKNELQNFWKALDGARVMPVTIGSRGPSPVLTFTLDPAKPHHGAVEITGDDYAAIFIDDGTLVGVKRGEQKEHIGFGKLSRPYGTGTGAEADRQSGWLLYGPRPAWLLAYAGRELPTTSADFNAGVEAASAAALEAKR